MYPFERFDEGAKKVLTLAQEESSQAGHSYIGTEHLLLGLLRAGGEATRLLDELGADEPTVRAAIARTLNRAEIRVQQVIPTARVKRVIELAFGAAQRERSSTVTAVHLLIGLLEEGQGVAAHVLGDLGVSLAGVYQAIGRRPPAERAQDPPRPGWPAPGARVLLHDPEPPYRLWEGTVTGLDGDLVTVSVPGHPGRPEARLPRSELHPVPPRGTDDCERCRWTPS